VLYVPLYHYKGLDLTALLYVGFFLLCVKGLRDWRADLHGRKAASAVGTPAASGATAITGGPR
jgi:nicotinamide mononucleotide transporter